MADVGREEIYQTLDVWLEDIYTPKIDFSRRKGRKKKDVEDQRRKKKRNILADKRKEDIFGRKNKTIMSLNQLDIDLLDKSKIPDRNMGSNAKNKSIKNS